MLIFIILLLLILFLLLNQPCKEQENFGCGSGKTCCGPGYYGEKFPNCNECPSDKPSSPLAERPLDDCTCQYRDIKACFACKNKCAPFNPYTKMCTPIKCPLGMSCKVVNKNAVCIRDW
jgi:hypothetical protein